jgi:hypothetical protein
MKVRIYKPAKSASQAGRARTHEWVIEPELATARTVEPLMGWVSAGDTLSEMRNKISFDTPADAVAFAKRKGWVYTLEEPSERRIIPRNYLDNFSITRPQDEERAASAKS